MSDIMKVGRYQLENLIQQGIQFIFGDLRSETERSEFTDPVLQKAVTMSEGALRQQLEPLPKDAAIVLLSHDGKLAADVAGRLETDGYKNVYIVRDGIRSLKS